MCLRVLISDTRVDPCLEAAHARDLMPVSETLIWAERCSEHESDELLHLRTITCLHRSDRSRFNVDVGFFFGFSIVVIFIRVSVGVVVIPISAFIFVNVLENVMILALIVSL